MHNLSIRIKVRYGKAFFYYVLLFPEKNGSQLTGKKEVVPPALPSPRMHFVRPGPPFLCFPTSRIFPETKVLCQYIAFLLPFRTFFVWKLIVLSVRFIYIIENSSVLLYTFAHG